LPSYRLGYLLPASWRGGHDIGVTRVIQILLDVVGLDTCAAISSHARRRYFLALAQLRQ